MRDVPPFSEHFPHINIHCKKISLV